MVWLRRLLIAVGVLVLLAGIGIAALFLLVDPNDYKATLQDAVKEQYGRTLVIDGDIRLSLVPRLGLEISGISLSEPQSNQVFAVLDTARAAVSWWPLLTRHLVIEHLAISGVKANVVRDADGRFNFDDLLRRPVEPSAPAGVPADPEQPSLQLAVAGVNVSGGDIAFRDERHDMAVRVERLVIAASGITLGQPFDVAVAGRVLGQSPRVDANVQVQGRLLVNPYAQRYAVHGLDLRMAGMLPSVRANSFALRGDVSLNLAEDDLDLTGLSAAFQGDLALPTPLSGVDAQVSAPRMALDLEGNLLQLDKVAAKVSGRADNMPFTAALDVPTLIITETSATGGPLTGTFTLDGPQAIDATLELSGLSGNVRQFDAKRLQVHAKLRQGDRSLAIDAGSPVSAQPRQARVALPQLKADVKVEDTARAEALAFEASGNAAYDGAAGTAQTELRASLPGGPIHLQLGASRLQEAVPALRFDVQAEHFDLAPWLAPTAGGAKSKPAPSPTAAGGKPPAEAANGNGDALFDLAPLKRVDAHGTLRVAELVTPKATARNLAATLALAGGRAELRDVSAALFEGRLAGTLFADANTQRLGVNAQFTDVAVQPLLHALAGYDDLTGKGIVKAELTTTGRTEAALRESLNGQLSLQLRDGSYRGINVAQSLREFRSLLGRGEAASAEADRTLSTDYAELRGNLHFADGVGTLRELNVAAPLVRITEGSPATVDLPGERLDLVLRTRVVNTSSGQGGKALERLRDVTVPIRVAGPFSSPTYTVMWNQVGSEALQRTLEREAGRQIERLLERRGGDQGSDENAGRDPGRIIGDALKGLFN
ncbi:AsmA family protein [Verticiella sediminum]|uniref:AsmA family protein n=1 Tax=Verticiella sediminum TaxID=1247510 RepID=A0A556B243_9BURK|nr:AsmA family protein [Verticiella sediminum]TSH99232.1 AsmA family protein [Verticiella sediminum]